MSSTISSTETQVLDKSPPKMEEKRLVRTTSLDRIKQIYICSQQYYIVPALLAWLKSSQSVLQISAEKTIHFFRFLIFTTFCKLVELYSYTVIVFLRIVNSARNPDFLLKAAVYLTASVLLLELGVCVYLLGSTILPGGLVFLIVCWLYICYLNFKSIFFASQQKKIEFNQKER